MKKDISVCKIDLSKDILEMIKNEDNISSIYLFGSRAYQTFSRRSDFDIIVFSKEGLSIDIRKLKVYLVKHNYLDIFFGSNETISSLSNDSYISLNKQRYKSIVEQLDAVELWNSTNGFVENNKHLLTQELLSNSYFPPSELNSKDPLHAIIKFQKKYVGQLDKKKQAYLNEACKAFAYNSPLAFFALVGSFFETVLIDLFKAYGARVSSKAYGYTSYESKVLQLRSRKKDGVYKRLNEFISFIDTKSDKDFYRQYLKGENAEFIKTTFDVVRRFRNDVDHSLEYNFSVRDCFAAIAMFNYHIPLVFDAINLLNMNPTL